MKRDEFEQLKSASIGHSLIKAARVFKEFSFDSFRDEIGIADLRPAHLELMAHIEFEGSTIVDIAAKAGISKQAVSVLVKEMLGFEVLKRLPHPTDKRASLISFNLESKNNIFKGMQFLASLDKDIIEALGEKQSKVFLKQLLKIITHFS